MKSGSAAAPRSISAVSGGPPCGCGAWGFVFQTFNLLQLLTARENVEIVLQLAGAPKAERRARAETVLRSVGLGDRLRHRPAQLSGGERQRVAIARALANNPDILLADEPTGNLDSATGMEIVGLLERLNRAGQTVVLVTHNMQVARRAGRVLHLHDGRLEVRPSGSVWRRLRRILLGW